MDKLPWASEVRTLVRKNPTIPKLISLSPGEGIMISLSNSRSIMAIFSGNLISKTSIQLQSQVLLIPWVKKNMKMGSISCSKRRDYSSSVPVRYIPKKSLENKESGASSSLPPTNLSEGVGKNNISLESRGKRVELSSSIQTSCGSRSFVPDGKFRDRNEKPISNVNCNVGLDTSRVVQSRSAQASCSTGSFIADTEFHNKTQDDKTISGLGTIRVVGSNGEGSELSNVAQTSCHSTSFNVDAEFESQNRKPNDIVNHDFGLDTTRAFESNGDRNELSNSALTSCSGLSFGFGTEFQNQNEKLIDSIKSDVGSYSSRVVRSNVQRSELSKSAQTSCSNRTFAGETKFQNRTEKPISSINNDVRLGTSRLVQSNDQRAELSNSTQTELSNSTQTSCSSQSFVVGSKFQNKYEKRIDYDFGLGIGEELNGHLQYEGYEIIEELEGFLEEQSNQGQGIQGFRIKQDVEKLAVELLATRAYTAVELRKKLLGKKFPVGVVDAVIMNFQSRGLINDGLYAETFSQSRWSSSAWGPRRIKKALYSKGVSDMDAEKAIKLVFNDAAASGDEESGLGMSKLSMDHLFAQASKQWLRSCGVSRETRKSRIIRWLQYRGFSWSIISFVLKKLESQYPS